MNYDRRRQARYSNLTLHHYRLAHHDFVVGVGQSSKWLEKSGR